MAKLSLAITGGIAEGKSTVLEILSQQGLQVLSADAIVREFWQSDDVVESIGEVLGLENPEPSHIRNLILDSPDARRALNQCLHPLVWDRIQSERPDAVEIPLLFEACLQSQFMRVWVVTCGIEEQHRRLRERYPTEDPRRFTATQLPSRAKVPFADEVIRTNSPMSDVQCAVEAAVARMFQS